MYNDFDNYEDSFPPEHMEFSVAINQLIDDEVAKRNKELSEQNAYLLSNKEIIEKQLSDLRFFKHGAEYDFKKTLEEAVKQAEIDTVKKITGGFVIGQHIWAVRQVGEDSLCPNCHGQKKYDVIIPDGTNRTSSISCPDCRGWGKITTYSSQPEQAKIYEINIVNDNHGWKMKGIRSAKKWNETGNVEMELSGCFATLEECQAACDQANLLISKKDG
jgi:hypothetical protein